MDIFTFESNRKEHDNYEGMSDQSGFSAHESASPVISKENRSSIQKTFDVNPSPNACDRMTGPFRMSSNQNLLS